MITYEIVGEIPSKKNRVRFNSVTKRTYHDSTFEQWHTAAMWQLASQGCKSKPRIEKVNSITIHFIYSTLRAKDLSNGAESLMDLLVDMGVIKDDNWKVVPKLVLIGEYQKDKAKAVIIIDEVLT